MSARKNDDRRRTAESVLRKLSDVNLPEYSTHGENSLGVNNFRDWARRSRTLTDPDMIRNALYYGFQPLYDCLILGDGVDGAQRQYALSALDGIVKTGVQF